MVFTPFNRRQTLAPTGERGARDSEHHYPSQLCQGPGKGAEFQTPSPVREVHSTEYSSKKKKWQNVVLTAC